MIIVLRTGIHQRGRNARRVFKNGSMKSRASFVTGSWCSLEDMISPDETHQPNGNFLSIHPVRTEVRGIVIREGFKIFPERFCVLIILREMKGAAEEKGKCEAGGLPEIFDVVVKIVESGK